MPDSITVGGSQFVCGTTQSGNITQSAAGEALRITAPEGKVVRLNFLAGTGADMTLEVDGVTIFDGVSVLTQGSDQLSGFFVSQVGFSLGTANFQTTSGVAAISDIIGREIILTRNSTATPNLDVDYSYSVEL